MEVLRADALEQRAGLLDLGLQFRIIGHVPKLEVVHELDQLGKGRLEEFQRLATRSFFQPTAMCETTPTIAARRTCCTS